MSSSSCKLGLAQALVELSKAGKFEYVDSAIGNARVADDGRVVLDISPFKARNREFSVAPLEMMMSMKHSGTYDKGAACVFGFGLFLVTNTLGRNVFDSQMDYCERMALSAGDIVEHALERVPNMPDGEREFVRKCIHPKPKMRPNMSCLVEELKDALSCDKIAEFVVTLEKSERFQSPMTCTPGPMTCSHVPAQSAARRTFPLRWWPPRTTQF